MTIEASRVSRLRLYQEPNGSFATDHSGTMGDFIDVPFVEGTLQMNLSRPSESPLHVVQQIWDYNVEVLLPKTATLSFSMNLETFDTKATNTVTATQGALGRMLDIGMGGENLRTGTTVNGTSATTTSIPLTSNSFSTGDAVAFATGSNGELEIREVDTVAGSTVNLKMALSSAPSDTDTAYGAASYYLGATDGGNITSYQFAVEGQEQDDRWLLMGGQLSAPPTLELGPGGIGRMNFQMVFADWDNADGSATSGTLTGVALAAASYSDNNPLVIQDSEYRLATVGSTTITGTLIHPSAFTFVPNYGYTPIRTPAGTNTVLQFAPVRQQGAPVSGTFTLPYEDTTYFTARDNRTNHAIFFQIGTVAADGGILISVPTVQIKEPQVEGSSGIQNQVVSWVARGDLDVIGAGDRANSPFRIHIV